MLSYFAWLRLVPRDCAPVVTVLVFAWATLRAADGEGPTTGDAMSDELELTESLASPVHVHDDHVHDQGDARYALHFTHPIITESPSPDTKARLDYEFQRILEGDEKARAHILRFEGEYAFHPTFSVEVDVPYVFFDPDGESAVSRLDNVEVGLKLANFAFAEQGVLLGYGIEFGLPTGNEERGIGTDHIFEIAPFFDAGYKVGPFELVGFATFGIPVNQSEGDEIENEFEFQASALYRVNPWLAGLVELDGEVVLNGEESGHTAAYVTPGFKVWPAPHIPLSVGLGVGLPITGRQEFEVRTVLSVYCHF